MHVQYQKWIPPTAPKDPIDGHETYTVWKKKKKNHPFFAYCLCK